MSQDLEHLRKRPEQLRQRSATISLRAWFVYLIVASALGATIVAGTAGWLSWRAQKTQMGLIFLATSRALAATVDRELDQAVALARGLSTSICLAKGDLVCFDRQARSALQTYRYALVLTTSEANRQLVNTQVPTGAPLPEVSSTWVEPAARAGSVAIKPLRRSRTTGLWVTTVQVPTTLPDGSGYVISVVIPSSAFQRIMNDQRMPQGWNSVILDRDWTVVAGLINPERFIGGPGATRELRDAPEADSIYETHVLEGNWSLAARSRSSRHGWTTAVSMPESELLRAGFGPMLLATLGGFGIAAVSIGVVAFFAVRLMRGITLLTKVAGALAQHEPVILPALPVRELAVVGEVMQEAGGQLRDQSRMLEARVAEVSRDLAHEAEQRRATEASLAHAQRLDALGKLTGGVAHDFNNLLQVISGTLELMHNRARNPAEVQRLVGIAQQGAARAARLVQALLAFARKQPLQPQTVNPNALIKEFAPVLKGALGDAVELQLLLNPTIHPCHVDPAQFQSALLNLATNAAAAMAGGGKFTVETENVALSGGSELPAGDYVRITVSDTGTGMAPEIAARAFEPFFTTKDVGKGTGLGLSQIYGFVTQSGGRAELTSEVGVGTVVRLLLPRSTALPQRAEATAPPLAAPADRPINVLVVEDDADVRAVLVEGLREAGFKVLEARDGPEALEMIAEGQDIDVVLTDYAMPRGMSGSDLGRHVGAMNRRIRIILISGNVTPTKDIPDDIPVLHKPFRQTDLDRAIRQAVAR